MQWEGGGIMHERGAGVVCSTHETVDNFVDIHLLPGKDVIRPVKSLLSSSPGQKILHSLYSLFFSLPGMDE
jgi:hypothetical protein